VIEAATLALAVLILGQAGTTSALTAAT